MFSAGELQCPKDMILRPAGRVTLGSPEGVGENDEHPARPTSLNAYCLDRYELANQEQPRLAALMAKQSMTAIDLRQSPVRFDGPQQPWIMNWFRADAICKAQGKRLPTEAELEAATRGKDGTCTVGTKSCTILKRTEAHYCEEGDCPSTTANVGSYPPTEEGFYDLAGNALEWVSDWYLRQYYTYRGDNPQGPAEDDLRISPWKKVVRGGSWSDGPTLVRAANRFSARPKDPDVFGSGVGVRCAADPISVETSAGKPQGSP